MKTRTIAHLVIGFGKAGKTLAADLAKHGESVILVEQSATMYGGTCINIGCIPSKLLLVEGEKSERLSDKSAAFTAAMQRREQLTSALRAANYNKLASIPGVEVLTGKARFLSPHVVEVTTESGVEQIEAKQIYINTGARSAKLSLEGADDKRIYDSTGLLQLESLPKRLVIVGGGYISLEFACMYAAFGSQVTILEQGSVFLAREDRDVAEAMLAMLSDRGIQVILQAETQRFVPAEDAVTVVTSQGDYAAEAVLVAIGRRPNVEELNLEAAGVALTPRGFIQVNEYLRAAPHIWAMGDVAGSPQFTYVSLDDYRIVRDQLFGEGKRTTRDRSLLPTSVFTTPALAQIGMTETQAAASGRPYEVKRLETVAIPKAKVLGETHGLLKAIVDKETGLILGATLFCPEAHELINLLKLAMDHQVPASALHTQIFTHPTIAEALNDLFAPN